MYEVTQTSIVYYSTQYVLRWLVQIHRRTHSHTDTDRYTERERERETHKMSMHFIIPLYFHRFFYSIGELDMIHQNILIFLHLAFKHLVLCQHNTALHQKKHVP